MKTGTEATGKTQCHRFLTFITGLIHLHVARASKPKLEPTQKLTMQIMRADTTEPIGGLGG